MSGILKTWQSLSLIIRIVIGMIIGIIGGLALPNQPAISIFGSAFVGLLKGIAPVLVFVLVVSALAKAEGNIGSRFRTVISLYLVSTFLAAASAVVASYMFPITLKLTNAATNTPPSGIGEVLTNLITNMVTNPVTSIMTGNYVGILTWAVIFGLAVKKLAEPETCRVISDFAKVVSQAVTWIIQLAPFGIMGLVYNAVAESGLTIFSDYSKLLLVLVGCMFFVALVVDPLLVVMMLRRNPYPLVFRCLKESGLTAFFTRSSAANIPVNMSLCERMGLDKDFYSVSIPLGATINMDGAAITITVMALAVAHTLGINVDMPTAIILSVLATIGACGTSGVTGGSILLIPMACSLFGVSNDIAMQAVGVGFIIGVVQDSCETALNSSADVIFAATAEFHERMQRGEDVKF